MEEDFFSVNKHILSITNYVTDIGILTENTIKDNINSQL